MGKLRLTLRDVLANSHRMNSKSVLLKKLHVVWDRARRKLPLVKGKKAPHREVQLEFGWVNRR